MKWGNRENSRLIEQAQQLTEQMPDSALTLLDMANTASFGKAEKAEYALLRVQARGLADMDLSTDAEIFMAREYFIGRKDWKNAALACFYAGLVAGYSDVTQEMNYYLEALDLAKKTNQTLLTGKIMYNLGYLNYYNQWYPDAIDMYRSALKHYQSAGGQYQQVVNTLISIGNAMLLCSQADSAQHYYNMALEQATLHEDAALQVMVYTNMGVAYREQGMLEKANLYSRQALKMATKDEEKLLIYFSFANEHHAQNKLDSARFYLEQAEPLINADNIHSWASLTYLYYLIEKDDGNLEKALKYYERYMSYWEEITQSSDRKLLLEMQKKYDSATKENAFNKLKNRWWKITGSLIGILLALAVFFIYVLRKSMKRKEELVKFQIENMEKQLVLEQIEREKMEKTIELENTIRQAQTLQKLIDHRDNEIKNKFLEKIGIIKNIALLSPYLEENALKNRTEERKLIEKTHNIVKKLNVKNFMDIANELYPGFTDKLKQSCSELEDREISICCLILFNFNNQELDLFVNHRLKGSLNTIQTWKTAIRRKLNISLHGDIKIWLLENIVKK